MPLTADNPLAGATNQRQRFLDACHCRPVDHPPVWLMRQAGRALPEYRELKGKHSFLQLVQTPELAAEVTLQPVRRFGFDAAILFSDILVVPEALGQSYQFREAGGIEMAFALRSAKDLQRLHWEGVTERLSYVARALGLLKAQLNHQVALLGFCGSPWTLANFMIEGGSASAFTQAKLWRQSDRPGFDYFMEKLSTSLIAYLRMQIEAGADAVQIFDTLGGLLDDASFADASARWIQFIVQGLGPRVPVIVFSKGPRTDWQSVVATGAQVVSLDHSVALTAARGFIPPSVAIQGNLEPAILTRTPELVAAAANRILQDMQGRRGFIFNLGHGLPPTAAIENVAKLVETVRSFAWVN